MSTLSNYRKEAKKMFILSVKKDITKWIINGDYYSPDYNNTHFWIDRNDFYNILRVCNKGNDEYLCIINWLFIPFNIKIFYYYLKIKKHFRRIRLDKKKIENITNIRKSLEDMKPEFIQEIRKEKLKKLE